MGSPQGPNIESEALVTKTGGTEKISTPFMKELCDLIVAAEPAPDNVYFPDLGVNEEVIGEAPIEARKIYTVIHGVIRTGRTLCLRQDFQRQGSDDVEGLVLFWASMRTEGQLQRLIGALNVLLWGSVNHALSEKLEGRSYPVLRKGWQVAVSTREYDDWYARSMQALFDRPAVPSE